MQTTVPGNPQLLAVSVISRIETLSYPFASIQDEQHFRAFLDTFATVELDDAIAEETALLRRRYRIKTPDAIIAACALVHGIPLATANVQDFRQALPQQLLIPVTLT